MTEYVEGMCRNEQHKVHSHLYAQTNAGLIPMCGYGWNRSDGEAFSILRGYSSSRGTCKLCKRNAAHGKDPIMAGWSHKTKWL